MPNVSLDLSCDRVSIDRGKYGRDMMVSLSGVDLGALIEAVGEAEILSQIGEDAARTHFRIKEGE